MALNINGTTGISGVDGSASAASIAGTDANTGLSFASDTVNINTGGTTKASISSVGKLTLTSTETANSNPVVLNASGQAYYQVITPNNTIGGIKFGDTDDDDVGAIKYGHGNNSMRFDVNTIERIRIDTDGSTSFFTGAGAGAAILTTNISAGTSYNLFQARRSASSITSQGTQCFFVTTNGNVYNTNNSYGSASDINLKENIVDANSQWNDIKALKVRNFNFKNDSEKVKMLGVVAQELETAGMSGLVNEHPDIDEDGNELKTVTKSVKYSILYMKAIKALQEAQARIETLETKVAALEAG